MAASTHPRVNPGRLVSLVDYKWRTDRLPNEDIVVPQEDLPDPDAENGVAPSFGGSVMAGGTNPVGIGARFQQHETLRDIERKWNDLALYRIHRGSPGNANNSTSRSSSIGAAAARGTTTSGSTQTTGASSSTATIGTAQ